MAKRGVRTRTMLSYRSELVQVAGGVIPSEQHVMNRYGRKIVVLVWYLYVDQAHNQYFRLHNLVDRTQLLAIKDKANDLDLESYMVNYNKPPGKQRATYQPTQATERCNMLCVWIPNE